MISSDPVPEATASAADKIYLWYKPNNNQTSLKPDYYLHETDKWIVFPHDLAGLSMQEIETGKIERKPIFDLLKAARDA